MAEPHDRKPILTIEQQIERLKQKGVAFELCSEEEAADYLRDKCTFFKLASYRKLFSKYEGGPRDGRYVDLDFGQLRLLAALDQKLRHALLGMTLDIEHFQKVTLLREMEDRGEDGYAIVADYMASLTTANREYRLRELKMSGRSPYSSSLYAKYSGDMPAWAFLELTSFGTLIDFVRFCARRWGDRRLEASHYDLKRVKSVRNCAAHGSCLINCFAERGAARGSASSGVSQRVAAVGIPKATRRKWMGNTAMQEVATVLVAHSGLVPEGSSRSRAASELAEMFARADGETEALPDKRPMPQLPFTPLARAVLSLENVQILFLSLAKTALSSTPNLRASDSSSYSRSNILTAGKSPSPYALLRTHTGSAGSSWCRGSQWTPTSSRGAEGDDGGDRPGAARGRAREGASRREELEDDHDQEH